MSHVVVNEHHLANNPMNEFPKKTLVYLRRVQIGKQFLIQNV
jgi:hypothetical protein